MAAIVPAFGYESYFAIGKEATWKTPVAPTHKYGIYELEVIPKLNTYQSRTLAGGTVSKFSMLQGVVAYDIRILMTLSYDFCMRFIDGTMGVTTFGTETAPTGAGPYTYTWLEKSTLQSYTIETIEGNRGLAGATGKCNTYAGCKVKSLKIHGEASPAEGSACTLEIVFTAPTVVVNNAQTVITNVATETPVYFHQATTVDDGTTDAFVASGLTNIIMKSFDLTIDLNVTDRYMIGLASVFEPQRTGYVSSQFSFVKEMQTNLAFVDAVGFVDGSPKLLFDNAGAGAANRQFTFEAAKAKITTHSTPARDPGIMEQSITWDVIYDGTLLSGLRIINISGQATMATAA